MRHAAPSMPQRAAIAAVCAAAGEPVRSRLAAAGEPVRAALAAVRAPPRGATRSRRPTRSRRSRARSRRRTRSSPRRRIRARRLRVNAPGGSDFDPSQPYTYTIVKSGPDVSPDEVERARCGRRSDGLVGHEHAPRLAPDAAAEDFYVGEEQARTSLRLLHPEREARHHARAGRRRRRRQRGARDAPALRRGTVEIPGQGTLTFQDLDRAGPRAAVRRAERRAPVRAPGGREGAHRARGTASSSRSARSTRASRRQSASFAELRAGRVHVLRPLVPRSTSASSRRWRSSCRRMGGDDDEAIDKDQLFLMQQIPEGRCRARAGREGDRAGRRERTPTTRKAAPVRAPRAKRVRWVTRTPRPRTSATACRARRTTRIRTSRARPRCAKRRSSA